MKNERSNPQNEWDRLERLVAAIEKSGIDIAPDYHPYMQLAFALSNSYGEGGRPYFHRICRLSDKYNEAHADKIFSDALKNNRGGCTLGTLYHLVGEANVPLDDSVRHDAMSLNGREAASLNGRNATNLNGRNAASPNERGPKGPSGHRGPDERFKIRSSDAFVRSGAGVPYYKGEELTGPDTAPVDLPADPDAEPTDGEAESGYEGSAPTSPLPTFAPYAWPRRIARILDLAAGESPRERDILLLTAVATLGGCMARLVKTSYKGYYYFPTLQLFVTAPPASGKGAMQLVRLLVEPLHQEKLQASLQAFRAYEKELFRLSALGKAKVNEEPPVKPYLKVVLLPGDSTGTAIEQMIIESDGVGIIFEPEADTVATAVASEYGHWSDMLRNTFDHERLAYHRRGNGGEYREVSESLLTVVLSGTPAQVKALIPSAENGLFSRNMYYYLQSKPKWEDQFGGQQDDLRSAFEHMALEWKDDLKRLQQLGQFSLVLTPAQQDRFNARFSQLNDRALLASGFEMVGFVRRLAINLLRMMEVVAVERVDDELPAGDLSRVKSLPHCTPADTVNGENRKDGIIPSWTLSLSDDDLEAVLALAEPLYEHAAHVLSFLPHEEIKRRCTSEMDRLFGSLPQRFTTAQLLQRAEELNINPNTAKTWVNRLSAKKGPIVRIQRGVYEIRVNGSDGDFYPQWAA